MGFEVKLKDLTSKIGSGATPRGGQAAYLENGEIHLIRSQNIYNHKFEWNGIAYISEEQAEKLKNVIVEENDILINITGDSIARNMLASSEFLPARVNQHVSIVRCNLEVLDPAYLSAVLTSRNMQQQLLSLGQTGGTRAALTKGMLENLEIPIFDIVKQRLIGQVLNMFNNKIENNNKIIESLEELAQTLFKRWFVDFEFPNEDGNPYKSNGGVMVESELGMVPGGWEIGTIGSLAKVRSGYAFKSAWWSKEGDSVIKIKDIENNTINLSDLSCVSQEKGDLAKDFQVTAGDLLIALTGATLGKIGLVPKADKNLLVNQRVGKFFLGKEPLKKVAFLYSVLSQSKIMDAIVDRGSGSAQPNLSPTNLENINIVIPNQSTIQLFNKKMLPVMELLVTKHYENTKLAAIRDTLLPKLLSGEIQLPEDGEVGL